MIGYAPLNQLPKASAMIELLQVAQLMHDDVVLEVFWQKEHLVTEIEIAQRRTASPAAARVADSNSVVGKIVDRIPLRKLHKHELSRLFLVCQVMLGDTASSSPYPLESPAHRRPV